MSITHDDVAAVLLVLAIFWTVLGLRPLIHVTIHNGTASLWPSLVALAFWIGWVVYR